MVPAEQPDIFDKLDRTRRNFLAIGTILVGAALSGCKPNEVTASKVADVDPTKPRRGHPGRQGPNCYLQGTRILTPDGEKKIEDIAIGGSILQVDGETGVVRWIGRRRYTKPENAPWDDNLKPIRISQGALGALAPHADLFVSQNHRLYIDGILIRAADLVNGTTIVVDDSDHRSELSYLHIMTQQHSLLLSQGLTSETLLYDPLVIREFDNQAEFEALYGAPTTGREQPCAPVYGDVGRRSRLHSHFRNALSPWIDRRDKLDIVRDRLSAGTLLPIRSA